MSLEDVSLESDGLSLQQEQPSEKSEKQKESAKKAQQQLQKTQKDEKKAKADNDDLFALLFRFIQNPFYEELVPYITLLLQADFPSRFLLCLIALVFPDASHFLLEKTGFGKEKERIFSLHKYPEPVLFHNDHIHITLRDWITLWLGANQKYLSEQETSVILTKKLSELLKEGKTYSIAQTAFTIFFVFFFREKRVIIDTSMAQAYSDFILKDIINVLEHTLSNMDNDLQKDDFVSARDLFGV